MTEAVENMPWRGLPDDSSSRSSAPAEAGVPGGARPVRDAAGTPADGGKAIRPALALLSAEAVSGSAGDALPAAVAVELVHNFSLLRDDVMHDDVMDGDLTRRHRKTAWAVFGVNSAILAGDALLTLALDVLARSGHPAANDGIRILALARLITRRDH